MEWHPTDEDLILLFYGEASPLDERARLSTHLDACPSCRAQYEEIEESLALVTNADVPAPLAGFDARLWSRLEQALPLRRTHWSARQGALVLAWAALVALTVALGHQWVRSTQPPPVLQDTVAVFDDTTLQERVLLEALDQHFDQTETLLVELLNGPSDASGLAFERATADDLISSGRLYRKTAQQTGERQFADVLDDLELVLVEVARSPDRIAENDVDGWREQIEENGLLFKVRSVTHEIRARQDELTPASKGAL